MLRFINYKMPKDNSVKQNKKIITVQNGISNLMTKQIENNAFSWEETVTVIDLSGKKISGFEDSVAFPKNLVNLDLSHNKLVEVPAIVLKLDKLIYLNLAHNAIEYFDDYPEFCHTLEHLDLSDNNMYGPPYWVWASTPQKLTKLILSNNCKITRSLVDGYFEELLQYPTLVTEVYIENCRLGKYTKLFSTFPKATTLRLGCNDYTSAANSLIELPSNGLDKCCDLKTLTACNTHIYTVNTHIEQFKNLIELNLAENNLNGLPNEFCNLESLEVCVLSSNKILYLPEDIYKLRRLRKLYVNNNELCMLPEKLITLKNLKTLDVYDNHLNEVPSYDSLDEFDLALNYCDEPNEDTYLEKKERLRLVHENRYNGSKEMITRSDDSNEERSSVEEDDEELYDIFYNGKITESPAPVQPASSPEDWDSDEYWEPFNIHPVPPAPSPWLIFVKQKMKEGNFCPMDAHVPSVADIIKYKRSINPPVYYESDGQFDDCSSDET